LEEEEALGPTLVHPQVDLDHRLLREDSSVLPRQVSEVRLVSPSLSLLPSFQLELKADLSFLPPPFLPSLLLLLLLSSNRSQPLSSLARRPIYSSRSRRSPRQRNCLARLAADSGWKRTWRSEDERLLPDHHLDA